MNIKTHNYIPLHMKFGYWPTLKRLALSNKGAEELKQACTADKNVKLYNHFVKQFNFLRKYYIPTI